MKKAATKNTPAKQNGSPNDIDAYIAAAPIETQAHLETLRTAIKSAAPEAEEILSYQMPTYTMGRALASISVAKNYVGMYVKSKTIFESFKDELKPYNPTGITIRFPLDKPIPTALVKKLIKARVDEVSAGAKPAPGATKDKSAGAKPKQDDGKITVRNPNVPGHTSRVDATKYNAMKRALLKVLPAKAPGMTQAEFMAAVLPHLPEDLFPGGKTAGWWSKGVQLDLEAQGVLVREVSKPLRWHRDKATAL